MSTQTANPNLPDYITKPARDMLDEVRICRDVTRGTDYLRGRSTRYLPQHEGEETGRYKVRLGMAVLLNAMERTVSGLGGMVFRRDPEPVDVPDVIAEHMENIDNAGTHIDPFTRAVFEDGLESGHAGILVDAPAVADADGRRLSIAEEQERGVRPYWVHVRKEQIIGWRTAVENGRTVLTQLVIHEPVEEPDGPFGSKEVHRYRVYRRAEGRVTVEVWRKDEEGEEPVAETEAVTVANQSDIPFAPYYARKTGLLQSRPPLVDLAHVNIGHYQTLADHRYCLHISNVLTPVISGMPTNAEIEFGPNSGILIPDPTGKAYYLEPEGNAFETNLEQLKEFKADMAAMGLAMLQRETRAAETAESKRIDKSVEDSALAAAVRSLEDCVNQALLFHGAFLRIADPGTVNINREFEDQTLAPEEVERFSQLVLRGQWSLDTLWAKLSEGNINPEGFDPEVEASRLDGGMEAMI